jgi:hypothetical protein
MGTVRFIPNSLDAYGVKVKKDTLSGDFVVPRLFLHQCQVSYILLKSLSKKNKTENGCGPMPNTAVYSRSLERKKVQAFCLLQIFFSGIRTT